MSSPHAASTSNAAKRTPLRYRARRRSTTRNPSANSHEPAALPPALQPPAPPSSSSSPVAPLLPSQSASAEPHASLQVPSVAQQSVSSVGQSGWHSLPGPQPAQSASVEMS